MERTSITIDDAVEAYEAAHAKQPSVADVADYFPSESHPAFCTIAVELLRVDLEYFFDADADSQLDDYLERFPLVFASETEVRDLAFEHFRLSKRARINVSATDYAARYKIDTSDWLARFTTKRAVTATNFNTPASVVHDQLLVSGFEFESFVLQEAIGEGALSRVFLARQSKVANRRVVLKFQHERTPEVARLGRLQHPNIVPILSVHPYAEGSAICMPYLGKRTLRQLLAGKTKPAVDTLSIGVDLAAALEHAHQRGVMHGDIKPANILISDNNRAMLLDFNLAGDLTQAQPSLVGGTPAYMSPEQHDALEEPSQGYRVDHRSDLYSLGAVLFESLHGQKYSSRTNKDQPTPGSAALNAIIAKCLRDKPNERYQSATELLEDLQNQASHQPLKHQPEPSLQERSRKWIRRHPRASSVVVLCLLFAVILFGVNSVWNTKRDQIVAQQSHQLLLEETVRVRSLLALNDSESDALADGLQRGQELLAEVRQANTTAELLTASEQQEQTQAIGELLFYLAQASHRLSSVQATESDRQTLIADSRNFSTQAIDWFEQNSVLTPLAVRLQHHRLHEIEDDIETTEVTNNPLDQLMLAIEYNQTGQFEKTIKHLEVVKSQFANDVSFWNLMGSAYAGSQQFKLAESCFTTCVAFKPESWIAWCNRGLARMASGNPRKAIDDFEHVVELRPDHWSSYLNRAITKAGIGQLQAAIDDLNRCEEHNGPTRIYFLRARYHAALGNHAAAQADHQLGLHTTPTDSKSWISRGVAKVARNPELALSDFREATRLKPDSANGLRNIAHVLSEHLKRPEEAIQTLTTLLQKHPTDAAALTGRAVLFARLNQPEPAIADARHALQLSTTPLTRYQAACVYALLANENDSYTDRSIALLALAFEGQPSLVAFSETDPDLARLVKTESYLELVSATKSIRRIKAANQEQP